jgi:hypothetical protein
MTPPDNRGRTRRDRDPVMWIFVGYVLVWLLEGVARKWLLPSLQQPLYFLRAPFVLAAIGLALRRVGSPPPAAVKFALIGTTAVGLFGIGHILVGDQSVVSAVLGCRLLLEAVLSPLAFAVLVRQHHVVAAARWLSGFSPPIALLAIVQVLSPPTAAVNQIFAADGTDVFTNVGGAVRASGTFTSSAGHAMFISMAAAAGLVLLLPGSPPKDRTLGILAILSAVMMAPLSGSRSALFGLALVGASVAVIHVLRRPLSAPLVLGAGGALGLLGWVLAPRVAPASFGGLTTRLFGEGADSEAGSRVTSSAFSWIDVIGSSPPLGTGLGSAAQGLRNRGGGALLIEGELMRWVVELGPVIFVVMLTLRLGATLLLGWIGLRLGLQGSVGAAALVGVALPIWSTGQLTGQGTATGLGVIAASCLIGLARVQEQPLIGDDHALGAVPLAVASRRGHVRGTEQSLRDRPRKILDTPSSKCACGRTAGLHQTCLGRNHNSTPR